MEEVFRKRPFKIRNADEYDLDNVLNLFVSPLDGLTNPFEYENTLVKGRMGSGKTLYLRANLAYHLYRLVPCLIDNSFELILPVLIRLSDFQHIREPSLIYKAVITKIIEELTSIYIHLQDANKLASIHNGIRYYSDDIFNSDKLSESIRQLTMLESDEYVRKVTNDLGLKCGIKHSFFELSKEWRETELAEIKKKANPGIDDIEVCYKNLLKKQKGKILLLIDEAGSLDKNFFQCESGQAFFEILLNQFRTTSFIRTKVAIYPNTYSDILPETRYGDVVRLEETVNNEAGYKRYRTRVINLIHNYINPDTYKETTYHPNDLIKISDSSEYGDCLEQLIYASNGNMRRLIHLLDMSMNIAYLENNYAIKINMGHTMDAIKQHAEIIESLFSEQEKKFLSNIIRVCQTKYVYRFKCPNMSEVLNKYYNKSQEYNIINIVSLGAGRKGTEYSIDYSYCVLKDIPTHYQRDTENICLERSLKCGKWINASTQINRDLLT